MRYRINETDYTEVNNFALERLENDNLSLYIMLMKIIILTYSYWTEVVSLLYAC